MKARSGKRPERRDRRPGGKPSRPKQTSDRPPIGDPGTDVEAELAGSGRTGEAPRERLGGARRARRSRSDAEMSGGSAVAPTAKAEARERQRHRLQRKAGVVPAGESGNRRQRRGPEATRARLDAAARKADRLVR